MDTIFLDNLDLEEKLDAVKDEIMAKLFGIQTQLSKQHEIVIDKIFELLEKKLDDSKNEIIAKLSGFKEKEFCNDGMDSIDLFSKKITDLEKTISNLLERISILENRGSCQTRSVLLETYNLLG